MLEHYSTTAGLLAMAAVLAILVTVIHRAVGSISGATGWRRLPFAIAVSLLCVIGLWGTSTTTKGDQGAESLPVILLSYAALAITILLLPLVLIAVRLWERWQAHRLRRRQDWRATEPPSRPRRHAPSHGRGDRRTP